MLSAFLSLQAQAERLSIVYTHENRHFENLFEDFEREHKVSIAPVWIDQLALKGRLLVVSESKQTPDIMFVPSDFLGFKDYIHLSELPEEKLIQPMSKANEDSAKIGSKAYGVPIITGNHLILYYNKEYIANAAKNWKELTSQKALLKPTLSLIDWSFLEMYWFIPFITGYGSVPMENGVPNLDSAGVISALQFVWSLAKKGIVDESCSYDCAFKRFVNGETAYTINGVWSYNQYREALGAKLGVAKLPRIGSTPMRSYFSTIVAAFPNDSLNGRKKEVINKLVAYIQTPEFQRKIWRELKDFPVRKDVLAEVASGQDEHIETMLAGLDEAVPMPKERNMLYIWEAMIKGFNRYGSGAMSAEESGRFMQKLTERSINR